MITQKRIFFLITVLLTLFLVAPVVASPGQDAGGAKTVADVEFLGEVVVPTGTLFKGTEIGGLSSITFDAGRQVYYALSDDQGNRATGDPVRYYTVAIDLADGTDFSGQPDFSHDHSLFGNGSIQKT